LAFLRPASSAELRPGPVAFITKFHAFRLPRKSLQLDQSLAPTA